jgi:hypothetical protein
VAKFSIILLLVSAALLRGTPLFADCLEKPAVEAATRHWVCGDAEFKVREKSSPEILIRIAGALGDDRFLGERVEEGQAIELRGVERTESGIRPVIIAKAQKRDGKFQWEVTRYSYGPHGDEGYVVSSSGPEISEQIFSPPPQHTVAAELHGVSFVVVGEVGRDDPELVIQRLVP